VTQYLILGLPPLWLTAPIGAVLALLLSWALYRTTKKREETKELQAIESSIEKGLKRHMASHYRILLIAVLLVFVPIAILTFHMRLMPVLTPLSFLTGAFLQTVLGYISIKRGFTSSIKTTEDSQISLSKGFKTAFRTSASIALLLNSIVILGVTAFFVVSVIVLKYNADQTAFVLFGFCFGTSIPSFLSRISNGIFTKSADIASDLVGKTEANIPDDDPRNPALIIDKIGNITGKIAGTGSDFFESLAFSISGAMIIGLYAATGRSVNDKMALASLPMAIFGAGTLISILGILMVRAKQTATAKHIFKYLRASVFVVYALSIVAAYYAVTLIIPNEIGIFWSAVSGILAGMIICEVSQYYTSYDQRPVQRVIHSTTGGPSTVIIDGLTAGMRSSWVPCMVVIVAILIAYMIPGGLNNPAIGLYGIGIAGAGMLSTIGTIFTLNNFGNISDNTAGIAKISTLEPFVKERVQSLQDMGVKTSSITRGIFLTYTMIITVTLLCTLKVETAPVTAKMLASIVLGGLAVFMLSGMIMKSVLKATHKMIEEIRRQFREIQGLASGNSKPNYAACLLISEKGSRKGMLAPLLLGIILPCAVSTLLGVSGSIGLLLGAAVIGFLFSAMFTTSGEMWSSTKRFIESGKHGGKDAPAHKAAVIADTVGDPLKDAVSPSINVFIKLMLIISVLFGGILSKYSEMILVLIKNIHLS